MPLTPDQQAELARLEAAYTTSIGEVGGPAVELIDDIDRLRRLRDLPFDPDEVRRRLQAEFPVFHAANHRIALWSLLHVALLVRAEHGDAVFVAVEETDQDRSGRLVFDSVLDAHGDCLDEDGASADDDDLRTALSYLDRSNRGVWEALAVEDGFGRNLRLDIGRIVETVSPVGIACSYPATFALADDEELLEVAFSYGVTGTSDWGAGVWYFAVRDTVTDVAAAMRAAVADYLAQPDANPNGYAFNWGDAVDEVPDDVWARHGLRPLDIPVGRSLDVDHDETFAEGDE